MSGSAYARLVPKLHRSRKLPKIDRPWRPRMIAWAGPTAFYPNRFYEIDKWYKARIDKPEKVPKFHIIDPANHQLSLAELLKKERPEPINIGFKLQDGTIMPKNTKNGVDLEKKARNMELLVDLSDIGDSPSRNICCHYNIFDDLFGKGVFFENVQKLDIAFGHNAVYYGNIISAETTSTIPKVSIESIKSGGLNTLIMVNIDGNPYDEVGEIAQWIVANIPDGYGIENGDQILPYMQPLPFCGTGYHRISFILFRHEKPITNFHKLDGSSLRGRVFSLSHFYKTNESVLTPSAILFFQSPYDDSVKQQMHSIDLKLPIYEYEYKAALKPDQKEFPYKPQPFDLYFDMYRDSKGVHAEILEERLKRVQLDDYGAPKWRDSNYNENKRNLPHWQHRRILSRDGRYQGIFNNVL